VNIAARPRFPIDFPGVERLLATPYDVLRRIPTVVAVAVGQVPAPPGGGQSGQAWTRAGGEADEADHRQHDGKCLRCRSRLAVREVGRCAGVVVRIRAPDGREPGCRR
jgi:hypothetical protein